MTGPALLERDAEVRAIAAALERARSGEGNVVVLEGPAGIGKTRLLKAAQEDAAEHGMHVLTARGGELEQEFASGVVRQLIERPLATAEPAERDAALSGPAGVAAAELGLVAAGGPAAAGRPGDEPADAAFTLLHGLYWLVANLAARRPVLLTVDDAHWADPPSLRFLRYLARRLEALPLTLLVAVRAGETGSDPQALREIVGDPAAAVVTPAPFSEDATRALLRAVLGDAVDVAFAAACHAATQGNPLLVRQLAEAMRAEGVDPADATPAQIAALGPRTVARSVLLRLGRQSPEATHLARAVAVLGVEAPLSVAAALAGLEPAQAASAATELRAIDVFDPSCGDPAFAHPIVRRAIYGDVRESERAAMHRTAADVLRADGAPAREVAPHLLAAGYAGDARAAATLREAAAQALREGAPGIAVRFLAHALDEPVDPVERGALLFELGRTQLVAGEMAGAAQSLAASVEATDDPHERSRRRLVLSRALMASEGALAAIEALEEGRSEAAGADREFALRLDAELAAVSVHSGVGSQRVGPLVERHRDLPGATTAECQLLAALARYLTLHDGTAPEAAELARRALRSGALLGEGTPESIPLHTAIFVLILSDEAEAAREALDHAYDDTREKGSVFGLGAVAVTSCFAAYRAGDLMVAESEARAALAALGRHATFWPTCVAVVVQSLLERGEIEAAASELRAHDALGPIPDVLTAHRVLIARAALALRQERHADALADLAEVAAREERWGIRHPDSGWRALAARVHWDMGEEAEAQRLAAAQVEAARAWGTETEIGAALRTSGLVGPLDEASLDALAEAVERLRRSPARLELARALIDHGAALRRRGRRTAAREPLREGVELARSCHALALASFGHEELLAAGARPRRLQFSGVEALTASERRVSELAAAGLGNREIAQTLFVTVKTVENHLARVFQKLGIRSRQEIAGALGEPANR